MSGIISAFRMNVMWRQIVQVAKWEAWAVLEQRYNTAKYLNRTAGTESNKISISMHLARKLLLAKMAWKFTFTFEIWSCGKRMLLLYSCWCCAIWKDNIPKNDSLPRGSRIEEKKWWNFTEWSQKDATRIFDSVSGRYMFPPILISFNLKVYGDGVLMCL